MATKRQRMSEDDLWDYMTHEAAMAAADEAVRHPVTLERRLRREGFDKLSALLEEPEPVPIPERIRDMSVDALVERLDELISDTPYPVSLDADEETLRQTLWDMEQRLGFGE